MEGRGGRRLDKNHSTADVMSLLGLYVVSTALIKNGA